jgi:hypothetical protein
MHQIIKQLCKPQTMQEESPFRLEWFEQQCDTLAIIP